MTVTNFTGEEKIEKMFARLKDLPKGGAVGDDGLVRFAIAPHAVYTVSEKLWVRCAEFARERNVVLHIHLSETQKEAADCIAEHGDSPVRWLDSLGVLGENVVAAHAVHIDDGEIDLLRERGVTVVHNPVSNMKLASGIFRAESVSRKGVKIALGTDGTASNNNLDMREEMKFAALLAKVGGNPEAAPANEVLGWATRGGFHAFDVDAGEIAEGKLADAVLVDLNNERMFPNHNLVSNWVYAADSRAIRHVICDGKFVMRDGFIPAEEEILTAVRNLSLLKK
jgi:5-methylthioadenosine/S-adenosylhomocysteine deaminase